MVKEAGEYKHSSYRSKVGEAEPGFLTYDPCYLGLGDTEDKRQRVYKKWFEESIPEDEWKNIQEAIQRNWAYGDSHFRMQIETALGRRFEIRKPGRKSQKECRGEM